MFRLVRRLPFVMLSVMATPSLAGVADPTASVLRHCLDAPANASTAGQTVCTARAARNYDRRLNMAYRALLRALPPAGARQLREAQRAWLRFRTADSAARAALFETRRGTMFVPMQALAGADAVRDRAQQLEAYLRVMRID